MTAKVHYLLLIAILVVGAGLRLWDTNWDQGYHLHPDERFLTMVANDATIPQSFSDYLNPKVSTLVPYNINHQYFTYGAFPVAITKVVAVTFGLNDYDNLAIVGRRLAALFDSCTILFVALLASRLISPATGLAAAVVYALSVLPIQHGHFFVVDPFAVSFFMLSAVLIFCTNMPLCAGIAFGAALGCKVSLVLQVPVLGVLLLLRERRIARLCVNLFLLVVGTYIGLRCADPKFFASASWLTPFINPHFIENLIELKRLSARSEHPWPPGVQWLSKPPFLFTIQNFMLYGFGLVGTWLAIWGAWANRRVPRVLLLCAWIGIFLLYCGSQFLQTMRYGYPIYPLAAIVAGVGLQSILAQYRTRAWVVTIGIVGGLAIWPAAFMNIYRGEHTRVEASRWLIENLPSDAKIGVEHWDDSLPLRLPGKDFNFTFVELPVFEVDSPQKLDTLNARIGEVDAIVFSSNRGWGSILPLAKTFPLTIGWYRTIMSGAGDFSLRHRVTRWPTLFGYEFGEQLADEAFSVYDHPEVLIFTRTSYPKS